MLGSNATYAIMGGTWLTPEKKARTTLEICDVNREQVLKDLC
jgi:hypothetical protein